MNEMDSLMFLSVMYIVIFVYLWKFLAINISWEKKKESLYLYFIRLFCGTFSMLASTKISRLFQIHL